MRAKNGSQKMPTHDDGDIVCGLLMSGNISSLLKNQSFFPIPNNKNEHQPKLSQGWLIY
jgi:hypothetical protein